MGPGVMLSGLAPKGQQETKKKRPECHADRSGSQRFQ
jgi:hypothetical protein